MPDEQTLERAHHDAEQGKSPSTQAGEFVREEIHHVRSGKHGAQSPAQAIAIGLSKARRAGVKLPAPRKGASKSTRASARRALSAGRRRKHKVSARRSRAITRALRRAGGGAATRRELAAHARGAAKRRTHAQRSASARKAARTKGAAARSAAARKAARTRARD